MNLDLFTRKRSAVFSECRRYRYLLSIQWDIEKEPMVFLMLNPSTADEVANDPTVERCERRARGRLDVGGLVVLNLFAWRATDPKQLLTVPDPVGPANDAAIRAMTNGRPVVCGWGTDGALGERAQQVLTILEAGGAETLCLGVNRDGSPKHPLYVPYSEHPRAYRWRNLTAMRAIDPVRAAAAPIAR